MKEVSCEVIRDLLPLYVDDAASQKTRELIQEHLNNCPDCREDLRLMRSQVSLPVDEDTQQVLNKIRARREQRVRNKKIAIISAVSAVVLIVLSSALFCLWYTRPQSWADLTGIMDQPDALSGHYLTYSGELADFIAWDLEEVDGGDAVAQRILNELSAVPYRASLHNLTDHIPLPITTYRNRGIGHVSLFIRSQDLQSGVSIDLYTDGEIDLYTFSPSGASGRVTYQTDASLYDAMANTVREYGVHSEIKSAGTIN